MNAHAPVAASRPVYRHSELRRLLAPESIAIVGVSPREGSFGIRSLENLEAYGGRIHLVNAKYKEVRGRACFPSVTALPEVPDCVLIATAKEQVEEIVRECAEIGVGGVVIFASGYAETGRPEDLAAQARLRAIARETGLKVVGPNCIGLANYVNGATISFAGIPRPKAPLVPHAIGLVSQSGALSFALGQAQEHGTSFSHVMASGNACDVDVADQIAFLAEEPACRAIACVFEGIADPLRLLEAARIAAACDKPVVLYKMARSESGAGAALSHTGAMAGSNAAWNALFDAGGVVTVDDIADLVETTVFFAKAPEPVGTGVAVVATSGGASVIAADEAERHGLTLPQPLPQTTEILQRHIPDFGSARNPCDVTAQVANNIDSLFACAEALFRDSTFAVVLSPIIFAYAFSTQRVAVFDQLARAHGKMACVPWLTENLEGPGTFEIEQSSRVALFRSMDRCFAALAAWQRRATWRARQAAMVPTPQAAHREAAAVATRIIVASAARVIAEREAKAVLAQYGIRVVQEALVDSADSAAEAADRMGYPAVLKVESPDLPHKTEAGAVRLDLRGAAQVRDAFDAILASAREYAPQARIEGVLVQPQVSAGVEVMLGARIDDSFGPLVVVGFGGVLAELLNDSASALAPFTPAVARELLGRLRGARLFAGFRNLPAVDLEVLAATISKFSEMVWDLRGQLAEVDVNPLICAGEQVIAVDALLVKRGAETGPHA